MQWFSQAPISQMVLKNFIKNSLIFKECPEEILIKMVIVLKISKSSWNTWVRSICDIVLSKYMEISD